MRHEHLVVTVDAGTKAHIDDDLKPGESLELWVADAIEAKLAESGVSHVSDDTNSGDEHFGRPTDQHYYEGFEHVDDCSI